MDIPDAEVHRGLYELVTRGLLPISLDATPAFEGDVLALTGAALCSRQLTDYMPPIDIALAHHTCSCGLWLCQFGVCICHFADRTWAGMHPYAVMILHTNRNQLVR